jgi:hypothetical protein
MFFVLRIDMHIGAPFALNQQGTVKPASTEPPKSSIPGRRTKYAYSRETAAGDAGVPLKDLAAWWSRVSQRLEVLAVEEAAEAGAPGFTS